MASQLLLLQLCLLSLLLATSRQSSCQTLRMLLPRTLLRPGFAFLKLPVYRLLLGFTLLYWLAIDWARTRCWRDPTSAFFAEDKAYEPAYSILRGQQANAFIDHADKNTLPFYFHTKASAHPTICVGITSVARKDANYLQGAVGSVLEGLTVWERGGVYLIVLIAHSNPAEHPAYTEPWLHTLTDKVLLYDPDIVDIERIRELETPEAKTSAREKGLLDYVYLLRACESLNASYTMMLEDDVIALDGWYHRTKKALSIAEKQTIAKGMDQCKYMPISNPQITSFIYLRNNRLIIQYSYRVIPSTLLHGAVPRMELGRMANLPSIFDPRCTRSSRAHSGHPLLPPSHNNISLEQGNSRPHPCHRSSPHPSLLCRGKNHNAPDPCRRTRDAQVRLLLPGVSLSTDTHQRSGVLVRVPENWLCRRTHGNLRR